MVKDRQSSTGVERLATNMPALPADWGGAQANLLGAPTADDTEVEDLLGQQAFRRLFAGPTGILRTHAASNGKDPEKSAGAVLWPEGLTVDITTAASNTLPLRVPLWKRQEPHEGQQFVDIFLSSASSTPQFSAAAEKQQGCFFPLAHRAWANAESKGKEGLGPPQGTQKALSC
jgi:hypothetical protein